MNDNEQDKYRDILGTFEVLEDDIDFNCWLSNSQKEGAKCRIQNFKSQLLDFFNESNQ